MRTKIEKLIDRLNEGLIERKDVIKVVLLAVLAGENAVLIGPPGTAKSLIARRIARSLAYETSLDSDYFEYLLTKFSTPEEIFGPLSISELKADRFRRNTQGYLPTVRIAFLDEIFKANSSILNALLTILNERLYHNGAERQVVQLISIIAASNELPADQEELAALYDRFLVRVLVDYVSEINLPNLFEDTEEPILYPSERLTANDLEVIRQSAAEVTVPVQVAKIVQQVWSAHREIFKEDRRESLSDRRLKKIIRLLRVSAATNGRCEVDCSDVFLIKDCLWNHPDNMQQVRDLVLTNLESQLPLAEGLEVPLELAEIKVPLSFRIVSTRMFGAIYDAMESIQSSLVGFELSNLSVKVGDTIEVNDPICTLQLSDGTKDVFSPLAGVVMDVLVQLGDRVSLDSVLVKVAPHAAIKAAKERSSLLVDQIRANIWL